MAPRTGAEATKRVSADGRGPIFWFTLHGSNPDSPGYGLFTRNSQDLSRRRLKAFSALGDMPAPAGHDRRHRVDVVLLALGRVGRAHRPSRT